MRSFVGLGIPTQHARQYETAVRSGGVLLSIEAANQAAADCVRRVLAEQDTRDIESFQPAR